MRVAHYTHARSQWSVHAQTMQRAQRATESGRREKDSGRQQLCVDRRCLMCSGQKKMPSATTLSGAQAVSWRAPHTHSEYKPHRKRLHSERQTHTAGDSMWALCRWTLCGGSLYADASCSAWVFDHRRLQLTSKKQHNTSQFSAPRAPIPIAPLRAGALL